MTASMTSLRMVVAGVVIAVAGTFAVTAFAHGGARFGGGPGMMAHGPFTGHGLEHMLEQIDATPEQRSQIQQITQAAAADLQAQRESHRALRQRMMQLFAQPTVDANAVEALRREMLAQHDQASQRMMQAMVAASRVLTPEQRSQLAERMTQRHERMQRHWQERRAGEPRPRSN